jgi:hypothetical protein
MEDYVKALDAVVGRTFAERGFFPNPHKAVDEWLGGRTFPWTPTLAVLLLPRKA